VEIALPPLNSLSAKKVIMRLRRQFGTVASLALAASLFAASASAQVVNSAAKPIALNAVLNQSLSVSLSGNAVNFNLVAGSANNPGSTSITATTSWTLNQLNRLFLVLGIVSLFAVPNPPGTVACQFYAEVATAQSEQLTSAPRRAYSSATLGFRYICRSAKCGTKLSASERRFRRERRLRT
jgi:hypothetical protein